MCYGEKHGQSSSPWSGFPLSLRKWKHREALFMVSPWRHKYSLGEARVSIGLEKKTDDWAKNKLHKMKQFHRMTSKSCTKPATTHTHTHTHTHTQCSFGFILLTWLKKKKKGKKKKGKHSWGMCEMCRVGGRVWHMWLFARHEKLPGLSRCGSSFHLCSHGCQLDMCSQMWRGLCVCVFTFCSPSASVWSVAHTNTVDDRPKSHITTLRSTPAAASSILKYKAKLN